MPERRFPVFSLAMVDAYRLGKIPENPVRSFGDDVVTLQHSKSPLRRSIPFY
jgi:hypothetical protein